ncbi:hypothetical protein [Halpernia sp. GG3]
MQPVNAVIFTTVSQTCSFEAQQGTQKSSGEFVTTHADSIAKPPVCGRPGSSLPQCPAACPTIIATKTKATAESAKSTTEFILKYVANPVIAATAIAPADQENIFFIHSFTLFQI